MSEYTGDEYAFGRNPNLQRSAAGRLLTGPSRFRETREARGIRLDRQGARYGNKWAQEKVGQYALKKKRVKSMITSGGNKAEIIQSMTNLAIPKILE